MQLHTGFAADIRRGCSLEPKAMLAEGVNFSKIQCTDREKMPVEVWWSLSTVEPSLGMVYGGVGQKIMGHSPLYQLKFNLAEVTKTRKSVERGLQPKALRRGKEVEGGAPSLIP